MAKKKVEDAPTATRRKVRATRTGYYEHTIRNVGDVFIQDDEISAFSDVWMEKVDEETPERITGSNAVIAEEHDRILRQKINLGDGDTGKPTGDTKVIGE